MKFIGRPIRNDLSYRVKEALALAFKEPRWPGEPSDVGRLCCVNRSPLVHDPDILSWHDYYVSLDVPHICIQRPNRGVEIWKERRASYFDNK